MAMTCKFCGTEIKENETECSFCGAAVENTSATVEEKPAPAVEEVKPEPVAAAPAAESKFVCSGCGKKYPAGTKFCSECGGKIEAKKPVVVQKEEAPKFACTGCGKEYPAGTKFCSECGGKVAEKSAAQPVKKIVCTKCGKEYPDGGKFCAECGGKIEETIVYPNDAPTFYRVILTSFGNNEDRFEEVMYKTVNFYDSEKDFFFDKIILAHAILMEDAEKLVSLVEKAGGKALIEEFSDIPDPDGVVYECRNCGELYDHDVTVCDFCDNETIEKSIRRDVWIKNAYHNERCVSALLPSDYRYFCWDCFRLSNTPEKCCGHVYDALQIRFCNLLSNNHNATAAYLLDKYPDLANGDCSYSPWWYVRDIESARKLVKNCTDINSSLLHDGIRYLRTAEFAKLIIDAGANKDALTHLLNSVHEQDDIAFAQALINAGADVGSLDVELLAMGVEVEILKLFLDNGADPNLCDDCFGSVLNTRIRERDNDLESIELLLQRGADPNMLTEGEDLDEEDNVIATFKETSLEYAVDISSSIEIIKLLIKYGADVNVKHYDGRSLVDMALDNGDVEIAELLKQHGAVANCKQETTVTATEKTPVEWIKEFFGDKVADLRTKSGLTAPVEFAYVATDTPFKYGLNKTNFTQGLQKLGITTNYDRCIMLFGVHHSGTWGANTTGGVITLDDIAWKDMDDNFYCFKWKDVSSIVQKTGGWKGEFIEVNGQYVIIEAMSDYFLGRENFAKFLSAISGCQVYRG